MGEAVTAFRLFNGIHPKEGRGNGREKGRENRRDQKTSKRENKKNVEKRKEKKSRHIIGLNNIILSKWKT